MLGASAFDCVGDGDLIADTDAAHCDQADDLSPLVDLEPRVRVIRAVAQHSVTEFDCTPPIRELPDVGGHARRAMRYHQKWALVDELTISNRFAHEQAPTVDGGPSRL